MSYVADPKPPGSSVRSVEAEVVGVSEDGYLVTVKTRDGRKLDVQVGSPSLSLGRDTDTFAGAGYNSAPEVGALAVLETSSQGEHYISRFIQPYVADGYQGRREAMRQGDQTLRSRNGAFVDILASGMVRTGASDLAQTVHSPLDDSIQQSVQNFTLATPLGSLLWLLDDGTRKGALRMLSRSSSEDGSPAASLALGDNPSGNLVELRTSSGKDSGFAIERAGNVRLDSSKDATVSAPTGKIRVDGKKVYLNSGASKGLKAFRSNFYERPVTVVQPGEPASIAKFPAQTPLQTSLAPQDAKRVLDPTQFLQVFTPLPIVDDEPSGTLVSDDPLPKL